MATYNGEKYIVAQMDSIRTQTMSVDEVIISDDHSTDQTKNVIEQYIAQYSLADTWKLIENPDKGVRSNFYNAIKHTTGDILFLCDQDDIWLPDKAAAITAVFENDSKIKCLNTSFQYIDKEGNEMPIKQDEDKANNNLILHPIDKNAVEKIPLSLVFRKNISPGMTMAFTREVAEEYLRCSELKVIHDWEINCLSAAMDGLFFYNAVLTYYRIHDMQTISIGNIKKRTKKEILDAKLASAPKTVAHGQAILDEIQKLTINNGTSEYIKTQRTLFQTKDAVVNGRKLYLIPKEIHQYLKCAKMYGNIDIRYAIIDALAAFTGKGKKHA